MARPLRLESEDGVYHVPNRGNYRADIFRNDKAKTAFLRCLDAACGKTGWRVHAWCLMSNHYHLADSTPNANLVEGMRWLQGTTATGGGVSLYFPRPSWQTGAGLPEGNMRCSPDVAALAVSNFFPYFHFLGVKRVAGGTSVASPMWAGMCALINQARSQAGLSPLGLLGPRIYPLLSSPAFNQMPIGAGFGEDPFSTTATNGAYRVGSNYTLLTGLGSPNVEYLVAALTMPESTPAPPPTTPTPTPAPSGGGGGGGGGGGALSPGFFVLLGLAAIFRGLQGILRQQVRG